MRDFDFESILREEVVRVTSEEEVIEDAAWKWLERCGWVATPMLLFAMKDLIREQMLGG
jgi:hypothetical protein